VPDSQSVSCLGQPRKLPVAECLVAAVLGLGLVDTACDSSLYGGAKEHAYSACGKGFPGDLGQTGVATQAAGELDLSDGSTTQSLGSDGILVLVSGCEHGASATITGPDMVRITAAIRTSDRAYKANYVSFATGIADPRFRGTLTVMRAGRTIGFIALCAQRSPGWPP
jgi:hypothetical protein